VEFGFLVVWSSVGYARKGGGAIGMLERKACSE
jgi:hypothetical protein